jgi:molybdate transport system substrate-binding protein
VRCRIGVLLWVPLLALPGCAGDDDGLVVLAASSLTDAFEEVVDRHEARHGVGATLVLGGSGALATQVREGAPADVFASADEVAMEGIDGAVPFATNRLVILVPEGNPRSITSLADLHGRRLAMCGPAAPCGRYADAAFDRAGVEVPPASREENARGVAQKVLAGEADAGLAYATDRVGGLDAGEVLPGVVPRYLIAALTDDGRAFVELVLGPEGQAALREHGFGPP